MQTPEITFLVVSVWGLFHYKFNKNFYLSATGEVLLIFARLLVGILPTSQVWKAELTQNKNICLFL